MLKRTITTKTSREEKYNLITKAIEDSDSMSESSNDTLVSFHEFVIVPLRTAYQMYYALYQFMLNFFMIVNGAAINDATLKDGPILSDTITNQSFIKAISEAVTTQKDKLRGDADKSLYLDLKYKMEDNGKITRTAPPILLMKLLITFTTNSGDLVKLSIGDGDIKRIAIDFAEYQRVCEHLIANVKYMIDKFTGLVPVQLIDKVTNANEGSVNWLEDAMNTKMFNKNNKLERQRDLFCLDNIYKLMPVAATILYETALMQNHWIDKFISPASKMTEANENSCTPILRDTFAEFKSELKSFSTKAENSTYISNLLFDPTNPMLLDIQSNKGLVYTYNQLIISYLSDLYDTQSRKIYTKTFATFAGSALVEAINGLAIPDFQFKTDLIPDNYCTVPKDQRVLSATIARVMQVMTSRVHPVSGLKIHELLSLQDVSMHTLEKYRAVLPMYARIFKMFRTQCQLYRKFRSGLRFIDDKFLKAIAAADAAAKDVAFLEAMEKSAAAYAAAAPGADANAVLKSVTDQLVPARTAATNAQTALDAAVNAADEAAITAAIADAEAKAGEAKAAKTKAIADVKKAETAAGATDDTKKAVANLEAWIDRNTANPANPTNPDTRYCDHKDGDEMQFVGNYESEKELGKYPNVTISYLDEMVNSISSLIEDIDTVQKELNESDTAVSLYFDMKKNFTKNYFSSSKELPFAPLSILAMGYNLSKDVAPIRGKNNQLLSSKFAYGMRSLLVDNFKISSTKIPYLRKLLDDFNGYATASNRISEDKYNDVLQYVGRSAGFIYDLRFYNGKVLSSTDFITNVQQVAAPAPADAPAKTFQEAKPGAEAMSLIESVNLISSRTKIADFVKGLITAPAGAPVTGNENPRLQAIMVNLIDAQIMPINVHSLMREIPLANLYNYAMTFDQMGTKSIPKPITDLLVTPYMTLDIADTFEDEVAGYRFIHDTLVTKTKSMHGADAANIKQRVDTKIYRNLLFLALVQVVIHKQVKVELEFVNTRVVDNTNAVGDLIVENNVRGKEVKDDLFEF
jgi:hypothetical protein